MLRPESTFIVYNRNQKNPNLFSDPRNVKPRGLETRGDCWDLWRKVRLPMAARRSGASVLHCPANTAPRLPLVPLLLTIHGLIPLEPVFSGPDGRTYE